MKRQAYVLFILIAAFIMPGCGYSARGKVIAGSVNSIEVIHNADPRSRGPGIPNADASIQRVVLDASPTAERPPISGRQFTNAAGEFRIRIDQSQREWKHHQWRVMARKRGYQSAEGVVQMPPNSTKWTILVTLAPSAGNDDLDASAESQP